MQEKIYKPRPHTSEPPRTGYIGTPVGAYETGVGSGAIGSCGILFFLELWNVWSCGIGVICGIGVGGGLIDEKGLLAK